MINILIGKTMKEARSENPNAHFHVIKGSECFTKFLFRKQINVKLNRGVITSSCWKTIEH